MRIVMTVSGTRPEYLARTLESWSAVRGIADATLTLCCEPHARSTYDVLARLGSTLPVPVEVVVNPVRLGVLDNPHAALSRAFAGSAPEDFVVLAEEDFIVSSDVIEYFTAAAARFREHPLVLAACTYRRDPGTHDEPWALEHAFAAGVWGTWADRWHDLLAPGWHARAVGPSPTRERGWDWGLTRLMRAGSYAVLPRLACSDHIGERGEHCDRAVFEKTRAVGFTASHPPFTSDLPVRLASDWPWRMG